MKHWFLYAMLVSGCGGTVLRPMDGLPSETVLPEYKIYNYLTDDLVDGFGATAGWHLIVDEGAVARAVQRDGILRVDVADGGRVWYAVQVCLLPLPLTEGKWKVIFEARSDAPRNMILDVAHVGGDWHSFSGRIDYPLDTEWKRFEADFEVEGRVEPLGRFEFNLGGEGVGAEFRNLQIVHDP
jgi:hypothetical protein